MNTIILKTRNVIILCSIVMSSFAFAQNYMPLPDSGVIWEVWKQSAQVWQYNSIYIPDSNPDTIINGITYHKLFSEEVDVFNPWPDPDPPYFIDPYYYAAFREDDSGHVYFIYPEFFSLGPDEVLYMDLTVQKGDTIKQLPCLSTATMFRLADLVVDSTDFISQGPYLRKRIFLRDLDPYSFEIYNIWVEGVGNIAAGLINYVDNGWSELNFISCMSVFDTIYYDGDIDLMPYKPGRCILPYVGINEVDIDISIKVYPSPAKDYVVFETVSNLRGAVVTITDITGRPVAAFPLTGEKTVWQTEGVNPGVYFYRLQTREGSSSGKFMIAP